MDRINREMMLLPYGKGFRVYRFGDRSMEYGYKVNVRRRTIEPFISDNPPDTCIVALRGPSDWNGFSVAYVAVKAGVRTGIITLTDVKGTRKIADRLGIKHCSLEESTFAESMRWLNDPKSIDNWLRNRQELYAKRASRLFSRQ